MRQSLQALTPIETPCIQTISGSECANAGCVCGSLRVPLLWRSLKRACVCVRVCLRLCVCVCVGVRVYVFYANRPPETTVVRGTQVTQVEPNLPSLSYGKHRRRPAPRPATNAGSRGLGGFSGRAQRQTQNAKHNSAADFSVGLARAPPEPGASAREPTETTLNSPR